MNPQVKIMNDLALKVAARFQAAEETPPDPVAFNAALAKLLQRLKKDAGASLIRQNYRGTGSQAFRRQLFTRFTDGTAMDIWLNKNYVNFMSLYNADGRPNNREKPEEIPYGDKTPEQVYAEVVKALKKWATP
jgi:hypothetical protein